VSKLLLPFPVIFFALQMGLLLEYSKNASFLSQYLLQKYFVESFVCDNFFYRVGSTNIFLGCLVFGICACSTYEWECTLGV